MVTIMVVIHKITWKEFKKVIQILKNFKPIAMISLHTIFPVMCAVRW